MKDPVEGAEPSSGIVIGGRIGYHLFQGFWHESIPSLSLFLTMLDKNRELGTCAMTQIDGADFLKRRLKEADIVGNITPLTP